MSPVKVSDNRKGDQELKTEFLDLREKKINHTEKEKKHNSNEKSEIWEMEGHAWRNSWE